MANASHRLDRYLVKVAGIQRRDAKRLLAAGKITVDEHLAHSLAQTVTDFSRVTVDGQSLPSEEPVYLMMNKPAGVVSALRDNQYPCVGDVLPTGTPTVHIAGRLDVGSTGLLLLTNDGAWSRRLSHPEQRVPKRYLIQLESPVTDRLIEGFRDGVWLDKEGVKTRPAELTDLGDGKASVILYEGRYRQIRRMAGLLGNRVIQLHREAIGPVELPLDLGAGEYRTVSAELTALILQKR